MAKSLAGELCVVTGGLGYSGQYVVRRLLEEGARVRTITTSGHRPNPFGERLEVRPMPFDDPAALADSLRGARLLVNTYWVRFNHERFRHAEAVENTRRLFAAAKAAGVQRVVHVSITNPREGSPLEYFHGKAVLERVLVESGLSHAILRPTVLFGREDILINNIAWMLRRFPVFGLFGRGDYRLQPIFVDDLAKLAVEEGARSEDVVRDAIGPETFTFRELVGTLGDAIGCRRPAISLPPRLGWLVGRALGALVGDVVITREEIEGLMADLLHVDSAPSGTTKLSEWARANGAALGRSWASELGRRR